ncbi:uncharacterized protein LOC110033018 [Phalaenopsis equestris]|uniref:uncharacterized protein LOC110033018 n=1 Tax=Phalaenopsis equestris TaxID=78828 RepID=UPI0009E217A3|nr:uncharacterized protein LOC110033018 [Phalaenopsis equestris]
MGRKKTVMIDDDEYSLPIDEQQVQASEKENRASINTGSKKNKKGGGGAKSQRHGGQEDLEIEQLAGAEDEEAKMSKDNVEEEDELISNVFSGKKKASKSKKDRVSQGNNVANVTAIGKEEGNQQDEEDAPVIVSFSGKKKPSKTKKEKNSQASSSFDANNLIWTIRDFPAYGMLSDWSITGKLIIFCLDGIWPVSASESSPDIPLKTGDSSRKDELDDFRYFQRIALLLQNTMFTGYFTHYNKEAEPSFVEKQLKHVCFETAKNKQTIGLSAAAFAQQFFTTTIARQLVNKLQQSQADP